MQLLTPEELAARWRITKGTLANWRAKGRGPTFTKLGNNILYNLSDVVEYETRNTWKGV